MITSDYKYFRIFALNTIINHPILLYINMRRIIWLWLTALLLTGCQENLDERLLRETSEYTRKHCPKQEDAFTRLDSITYQTNGRILHFWYALHGKGGSIENQMLLKTNYSAIEQELLRRLRGDVQWNECKNKGVNFKYNYILESNRQEFLTFYFTSEDYR